MTDVRSSDLVLATDSAALALAEEIERAKEYAAGAKASNTRRAYQSDWADFAGWCAERGLTPLPAEAPVVATYLAARAETLAVATLRRRLAAIAVAHRAAGHESPVESAPVPEVMSGIARAKGSAQRGRAPVLVEDLRAMVDALGDGLLATRDRAIVLSGFSTGCRRSELVALDVADLAFGARGVSVTIRRSKTDQEGAGRVVGVPFGRAATCPVRALRAWLDAAKIVEGPAFRAVNRAGRVSSRRLTAQVVRTVVLRAAERAGLDASRLGAHSLRVGLVTSAAIAGASDAAIQRQTGHASVAMLRRYTRDADLFRANIVDVIGL